MFDFWVHLRRGCRKALWFASSDWFIWFTRRASGLGSFTCRAAIDNQLLVRNLSLNTG